MENKELSEIEKIKKEVLKESSTENSWVDDINEGISEHTSKVIEFTEAYVAKKVTEAIQKAFSAGQKSQDDLHNKLYTTCFNDAGLKQHDGVLKEQARLEERKRVLDLAAECRITNEGFGEPVLRVKSLTEFIALRKRLEGTV